jgi:hypothetical protein
VLDDLVVGGDIRLLDRLAKVEPRVGVLEQVGDEAAALLHDAGAALVVLLLQQRAARGHRQARAGGRRRLDRLEPLGDLLQAAQDLGLL